MAVYTHPTVFRRCLNSIKNIMFSIQVSTLVNSLANKQTQRKKNTKAGMLTLRVNTGGFKVPFTVDQRSLPFQH